MKIFCIGRNYVDHAKELNNPVPSQPLVFMKPPTALLIENRDFYYPDFTKDLHYEAEIVLRVCRNGRSIDPKFARKYINKISLGIDFTARDIQAKCKAKGHPWEIAKAFDYSAPIGKMLDVEDSHWENIDFSLLKNGERVQIGQTKDLIFKFETLIAHLSKYFTLAKGDLIYTGTPAGVGQVKIGDKLEGFIGEEKMIECNIK
jgi:2-keto-4-pentenoate hydratase/2-oxohepta-3-ene-1,7-dioic acid hydratase in catechol pathway